MTTQSIKNAPDGALLDHAEAASRLKCSPALVRKLIQQRELEAVKVGALVRIEPAAIDRYIEAHRRPAAS
jgi:excisionase family DNA binding protein